jgi:NAD(P)-dependent dehydrogenase (short-subunit alcohol dehydrogenase family)
MRLQDKIAYISGGGSGIGAACAELFASEGARVALADLHHDKAKTVADRLAGQHFAGAVDVTSEDSLRTSLDAAEAALGPLDILVNCAGITLRNVPAGTNWVESWQMVMDVNVKGTMLASTLFCERAIAAKRPGAIVTLSSIFGQVGRPSVLNTPGDPYPHSKGAVIQITRDMAIGTAANGIRVNCLCPGFIRTPLTAALSAQPELEAQLVDRHPMGRLGEAHEVARCALFLVSDDASFVTGAVLAVDGGYLAA